MNSNTSTTAVEASSRRGHEVHFFEKDVPYYAGHRDLTEMDGGYLHLYSEWNQVWREASHELRDADVGMVTSYCPDGIAASELVIDSAKFRCFYDLDTPVTLSRLRAGQTLDYIGPRGLRDFDLVLSYTGGKALIEIESQLGARRVAPLYGSVDPEHHFPAAASDRYLADLSYLGTYAEDRQNALEKLFLEPARRMPDRRFMLGGAMYPEHFPWTENIFFVRHLPPPEHPAFFCSSQMTLNVTRQAMAEMGYCPSGRLFEAAACGVPIVSDYWAGLEDFFEPGEEILVARTSEDVIAAMDLPETDRMRVARRGRERTLACHTADLRARELENILSSGSPSEQACEPVLA